MTAVTQIPREAIEAAAPIIEEMESRYPETIIAQRALAAAYPIIEREVRERTIREVAEAMRTERQGRGLMGDEGAWRAAADFIERQFRVET